MDSVSTEFPTTYVLVQNECPQCAQLSPSKAPRTLSVKVGASDYSCLTNHLRMALKAQQYQIQ